MSGEKKVLNFFILLTMHVSGGVYTERSDHLFTTYTRIDEISLNKLL